MSSNKVLIVLSIAIFATGVQHTQCTNVSTAMYQREHSSNATNISNQAYINKYLPVMWSSLKNANTDKYLLTIQKLKIPSKQLYDRMKICILKYLHAIEPIAFVNASKLSNNSCGYMVLREHVGVLHMASTKAFRCLKSYKISTSITYVDAQTQELNEQPNADTMYSKCLDELVDEATNNFELLQQRLKECLKEFTAHDQNASNLTTADLNQKTTTTTAYKY
ncbi:uncharacterized protein LOC116337748 [Contarinia nasturtii]|uniref:uncharacterized protein LOC116337748 n=1 Tax=Contarinia nasturtii TaxID=265458 RepID=UPI0012D42AA0|nr:uncharacterized protein LOC116337748 [Contarinia nasturtii]XP_031618463.1 uncharacterized protein LOC116337748 [Contarinia nasturtii]